MTLSEQLEALDAKATAGPWKTAPDHMGGQEYETCIEVPGRAGQIGPAIADFHHDWEIDRISWAAAQSNAALCVTLRNAMPKIIAALRRAETSSSAVLGVTPSPTASPHALADRVETSAAPSDVVGLVEADEPISKDDLEKLRKDAGLDVLPTPFTYQLRRAVSGYKADEFLSWGYQWKDKPHRLVYAACERIERLIPTLTAQAQRIAELEEELAQQADGSNTIAGLLKGQPSAIAASLIGMLRIQEISARAALKGGTDA